MDDSNDHQVFRDLRMQNGYPDDTPQPELIRHETLKLSLLSPTARAEAIRNLENTVFSYDANSNLRAQTSGWRLVQSLKVADKRLKAAGR